MDKELFDDLYKMYILDENRLGIHDYFRRVNPASFQAMTAVMLESARKGYWKATKEQLKTTAALHARTTSEQGAACTEFVCGNDKLQAFVSEQLDRDTRQAYDRNMKAIRQVAGNDGKDIVLKGEGLTSREVFRKQTVNGLIIGSIVLIILLGLTVILLRRKNQSTDVEK